LERPDSLRKKGRWFHRNEGKKTLLGRGGNNARGIKKAGGKKNNALCEKKTEIIKRGKKVCIKKGHARKVGGSDR